MNGFAILNECFRCVLAPLFAAAANPMPSVTSGWQVRMWYGDPLCSQWYCGHRDQKYCSYNVPPHFSGTGKWNPYTIFDLHSPQWNFGPADSQIPCTASLLYNPAFWMHNHMQPYFLIHIMNGGWTIMEAFAYQIKRLAPVSLYSVVFVIYFTDLLLHPGFLGIVICLPVFPVVIVSIRANL